jgi:hypothetical protein
MRSNGRISRREVLVLVAVGSAGSVGVRLPESGYGIHGYGRGGYGENVRRPRSDEQGSRR